MMNKRFVFSIVFSSSILSTLLLAFLNFIFNEDGAGTLASVLQLGNGVIVAALLGDMFVVSVGETQTCGVFGKEAGRRTLLT